MAKGHQVNRVIKEVGSGVNDSRPKLLKLLADTSVTVIVVEHKDRLTRFGFKYIEVLLATQGRRIEVVNLSENMIEDIQGQQYPAERVVPTMGGELTLQHDQGSLLVTTYRGAPLEAWQPAQALANGSDDPPSEPSPLDQTALTAVGALLGRLHALDPAALASAGVARNGINLASELAWAAQCLAQVQGQVAPLYARLHKGIEQVTAFEGCQRTLIHGDCHVGNVVMQPPDDDAFVDWDAAGWGLAVTDLGLLLSSCTLRGDETSTRKAIEAVYGRTYDEWLHHEERATTIAEIARARFVATATQR